MFLVFNSMPADPISIYNNSPTPPPLREWETGWLGWPPAYGWVPVQQSCSCFNTWVALHAGHWTPPQDGLQTSPTPFAPQICQQVQGTNGELSVWCKSIPGEGQAWHGNVLQLPTTTCPHVCSRRQGFPWCKWHPHYLSFKEVGASTAWTIPCWGASWVPSVDK